MTRDRRKGRQRPPAGHLQVLTVPPRLTSVALTGGMEREEVGRGGRGTIGDRSLTGKPDNIWNSLARSAGYYLCNPWNAHLKRFVYIIAWFAVHFGN